MQGDASAVVFERVGDVGLTAIAVADPENGEVQVQTEISVISAGTEEWMLRDEFTWIRTPFPCVPGLSAGGHDHGGRFGCLGLGRWRACRRDDVPVAGLPIAHSGALCLACEH
jgi:hypothetical protein